MKIQVRLFAQAKEVAGAGEIEVELGASASVSDLRAALAQQHPTLAALLPTMFVAVDNQYAPDTATLDATQEVACFPPVSGG